MWKLKLKIWLLAKVFDFCATDVYRNIECGVVEDFDRELHTLLSYIQQPEQKKSKQEE